MQAEAVNHKPAHDKPAIKLHASTFASPVATSVDELVGLRSHAQALLRVKRKRVRAPRVGQSVSKVQGRGLDFSEVRSYQPGDDVRMIDWNVTARSGTAHTKLFVEEKERPFFLVVDCSASMQFATRGMFKSVMAARLASLLGWAAVTANDRVGGLLFADDWHQEIKPQAGRNGLMALFRGIAGSRSGEVDSGRMHEVVQSESDLVSEQLKRLRRLAHGGSEVIILSDFAGFNEQAEGSLAALQQKVELSAIHLSDPLERELPPPGFYPLSGRGIRAVMDTYGQTRRQQHASRYQQRSH